MLRMNQVDQIKELQRQGVGPKEINERLNLNRKTVARYMTREAFDTEAANKVEMPSRIDPYRGKIEEWLEEDRRMRFKQKHAAQRVHERLKEEFGDCFTCSYSIIQPARHPGASSSRAPPPAGSSGGRFHRHGEGTAPRLPHVGVTRTDEDPQLAPIADHDDFKADTSSATRTAVQRPGTERRTPDGKSV